MTDKTAIVTGASRGIGEHIAIKLAETHKNIVLIARNEEMLHRVADSVKRKGSNPLVFAFDLINVDKISELVDKVASTSSSLDTLVNCAGISRKGRAQDVDLSDFDQTLTLNVRALVHLTRHVLPHMIEQKAGAIINISSMAGIHAMGGASTYCASKHAVAAYTRALFDDVRDHGIKVSQICPGYVATDMTASLHLDQTKMIQPQDIAAAVDFVIRSSRTFCPTEIHLRPQQSQ